MIDRMMRTDIKAIQAPHAGRSKPERLNPHAERTGRISESQQGCSLGASNNQSLQPAGFQMPFKQIRVMQTKGRMPSWSK